MAKEKAAGAEKKETLILSAEEFVERILRPNLTTGRRFCFILGSGASMKSGIPAGNTLEMTWMNWLMGVAADSMAPGLVSPKLDESKVDEAYAKELIGAEKFQKIKEAWEPIWNDSKKSMPSEYYFDIYKLRFSPDLQSGDRYMERLMEASKPSLGYYTLARLLTERNQKEQAPSLAEKCKKEDCPALQENRQSSRHNLVITTNFDSLVEDALFIYTDKKPLVVSHEAMASYLQIGADIHRPIIAKVHRGLFLDPHNTQDTTKELDETWKEALDKVFEIYTPIVIGYGGGDQSLMSFLRAKASTIKKKGLYWCYLMMEEEPKDEAIQQLLRDAEGHFVAIPGFDMLMLKIGIDIYGDNSTGGPGGDPGGGPGGDSGGGPGGGSGPVSRLKKQFNQRVELYNKQAKDLIEKLREDEAKSEAATGESQHSISEEKPEEAIQNEASTPETSAKEALAAEEKNENEYKQIKEELFKFLMSSHLNEKAKEAFDKGNSEEAIKLLTQAIELDPDDAEAYNNRGAAYARDGKYNEAIADYNKAIELKPDYAAAYNNRGSAYGKEGKLDEAIADFSKAIELNPDLAEAYNNRGNAYSELKQYDKAIEDFSKAIELDPKDAEAYYNRGNVYNKQGKYDEAIADYSKAIELNPDLAAAYVNRGAAYNETGRNREAIADYNKAIELDPNDAEAYNNRAIAYAEEGKSDKAIEDFSKAIELKPDYAEAYNNRGVAYYELEQWGKAITDFSKAIELDPNDAVAYSNRGEAYCKLEDYDAAIRDCTRAIELGSDDLDALITAHTYRAEAYRAIGQIDLAEADEKCIEELDQENS